MNLINFSDNFQGFQEGEDILVDTGILFAYYNAYDTYYTVVKELFRVHVFSSKTNMFLYVNPTIVNEITHLARDPLKKYLNAHPQLVGQLTRQDAATLERTIVGNVKQLIENGILLVLDGDESSVLKQLDLYNQLAASDAVNASIANLFGANFLTVDSKLANNMKDLELELPNVQNIYYTTGHFRDYRIRINVTLNFGGGNWKMILANVCDHHLTSNGNTHRLSHLPS